MTQSTKPTSAPWTNTACCSAREPARWVLNISLKNVKPIMGFISDK